MSEQKNLVEVQHLQQYFPAGGMGKNKQYVQAVDDVSFAIRKGETLGLVGESGCGKTTTGRTLLRLYEPTDGTIIYDGKVLFDKKKKIAVDMLPYRRRMQIVFQDPYASLDPRMTIDAIKAQGCKVGMTIKPGTPVEELGYYLDQLDLVLVMSVEPGFGGQKFMPSALDKLRWLKAEKDRRGLKFLLEVDGGVDAATAPQCVDAGADVLVAGSAIFGAAAPAAAVRAMAAL